MSKYGIGIPEWRVLVSLGQFGVMTGKAIGARTHMHKTKVSRAVAQLEARKFVTRKANRADLREAFLSLTPAGRAVYEELAPRARDFTEKLSEVVTRGRPRRLRPRRGAADGTLRRAGGERRALASTTTRTDARLEHRLAGLSRTAARLRRGTP